MHKALQVVAPLAVAAILCFGGASHAAGFGDAIGKPKKSVMSDAGVIASAINPKDKDVPDWLRDSERLNAMLGGNADTRFENPRVVRKVTTPIAGLDGFVVQAEAFSSANPEGKQELFVFYTDKTRRFLVVGMMIDTEQNRDLNQMTERFVRGELADNPAHALRPQDMHGMILKGGKSKSPPLTFVVDLGPDAGKSSFLGVIKIYQALLSGGSNPRPLRIVPVSAGKDELSTGAMSMALGFDQINGDGIAKMIEFAEKGKNASWLDHKRLAKDAKLKQAIGTGVFKIDANSTQAMLARLDTLPLVYDGDGEGTKYIPLPTSPGEWRTLLLK